LSFEAILFIAVLVIAAKLGGELFHRIGQPTILGNVITDESIMSLLVETKKPKID